MRHKFFRYLIPVIAFVTIVGTGYSFFSYITFNNASLTGDNAPQVTVETRAEGGTLVITPNDLYLSVYQRRIALNADRLNAVYTIGTNWEENVIVPMLINKEIKQKDRKQKAMNLLKIVGLEERSDHEPREMSGGEQQRVAIARALANDPNIILADEPTGNLDEESEKEIFMLLKELSKQGRCVVVVSHSNYVKNYADKVYEMIDGRLKVVDK